MEEILKFDLFTGLEKDPETLKELSNLMKRESYNLRDLIINEKDSDPRMFFLVSGQVEINKKDEKGQIITIARADAKDHPYFGESVLFGYFARSANVVAYSRCECLSLSAKDLEDFVKNHPSMAATFYRNLGKVLFDRMRKATKDVFIASLELKK